jgi:endoglucanase
LVEKTHTSAEAMREAREDAQLLATLQFGARLLVCRADLQRFAARVTNDMCLPATFGLWAGSDPADEEEAMKLRFASLLTLVCLCLLPASASAAGNFANAGLPGASTTDPLAGMPWGIYKGTLDGIYSAWETATGPEKQLLAKEALQPLMFWFGSWNQNALAASTAREYIQAEQDGNPNALVQMAIFRLNPWEGYACQAVPTAADVTSYEQWINNWAQGIGSSRVAMVLQPDLPFEACEPNHSQVAAHEVAYAAKVFSALPHTTVYLDAGASDWEGVAPMSQMLIASGVRYTRGFALGDTHYTSTASELLYGRQIVRDLAAHRIGNMHFIINTAQNGRPFSYQHYTDEFKSAAPCATKTSTHCVTLGIPPTTNVAGDPAQDGLTAGEARIAAKLCDGYLWFGRPWLNEQKGPFYASLALQLAATTPF